MAVTFKMIPKKNMQVSPPEVKYYPCAVSQGRVDLDTLSQIVASRSTVSEADCYGVIVGLTRAIGESLLNGHIVDIDFLGSFALTLQGTAADSEADLGKANIKKTKVIFSPSKGLKSRLKEISFKRLR
ncbi:HU family DNA-binding protein [Flavobacterium phycosphaerae]|uniref:HU family DNA-binding protein n=1 Tax=Flavobacterium phycosphaerae TaxID=2697515 RepID=UPI0013894A3A|nr:HU family DNA-binding protein [Flavobacterium phycosphaerae]